MFGLTLSSTAPDSVAHIIQVALAPAFLLSAMATFLNVFSTRLARIADKVNATSERMRVADAGEARRLTARLAFLRRRSFLLDTAVVFVCLGAALVMVSVLALFVGALRDGTAASMLFACFGASLVMGVGAICAFLAEVLLAGRGVRIAVDREREAVATTPLPREGREAA